MNEEQRPRVRYDEFEGRPKLVAARARSIIFTRLGAGAIGVFMLLALMGLVVDTIRGEYRRELLLETQQTLLDCTVPDGVCYQRNQENTAKVIQHLIKSDNANAVDTRRVMILAIGCGEEPGVDTLFEVEECVNNKLEESERNERNSR